MVVELCAGRVAVAVRFLYLGGKERGGGGSQWSWGGQGKGLDQESRGQILNERMFFHGKSGSLVIIFQ
jgi:hypothetical protein